MSEILPRMPHAGHSRPPLDGIFPRSEYLVPTDLIGVHDTDPVYPVTKPLWSSAFPVLRTARIKWSRGSWAIRVRTALMSACQLAPTSSRRTRSSADGLEQRLESSFPRNQTQSVSCLFATL